MPPRKKAMARGEGPKRTGRIKPMSDKRRAAIPSRVEVRKAVLKRDGYRCRLRDVPGVGECMGELQMHEKLKASQGKDTYTVENGATLCSHHNTLIETDARVADIAHGLGLVIRRADRGGPL